MVISSAIETLKQILNESFGCGKAGFTQFLYVAQEVVVGDISERKDGGRERKMLRASLAGDSSEMERIAFTGGMTAFDRAC